MVVPYEFINVFSRKYINKLVYVYKITMNKNVNNTAMADLYYNIALSETLLIPCSISIYYELIISS